MRTLGILFSYGRNSHHAAVAMFTMQPANKASFSIAVSIRFVFARRCSHDIAALVAWIT